MRYVSIAILSLLVIGCADRTYYACRDSGSSREFCSGLPGTPTGTVLTAQSAILTPAIRTASLDHPAH